MRFYYYVGEGVCPLFEQTCMNFLHQQCFCRIGLSLKLAGGFGKVTTEFYYVGEVVWPFIHCMNKREFPTSKILL